MSGSYRSIVFALGLILSGPANSQKPEPNQGQASDNAVGQPDRTAATFEKLPISPAPDKGCERGQDDRQSDLCAQWKAADAAADSATWAYWTFWTGLLGLVIGGGTLFAAWRAAHWAKEAANHSQASALEGKRAADSAVEANRNVRAWIANIPTQQGPSEQNKGSGLVIDGYYFFLRFQNVGQSPAYNVTTYCTHKTLDRGSSVPTIEPEITEDIQSYIIPHGNVDAFHAKPVFLDVVTFSAFRKGEIDVILYAKVSYQLHSHSEGGGGDWHYTEVTLKAVHWGGTIGPTGNVQEAIRFTPVGPQNRMT